MCLCKCGSTAKLQKSHASAYNNMLMLLCTFTCCSVWVCPLQLIYETIYVTACLHVVNKCEPLHVSACVKERERVCVHVCAADVLCSVLFPRLAGLCCCSLVQTGLATCSSVCKGKPRLCLFYLSIAAAKSRPSHHP